MAGDLGTAGRTVARGPVSQVRRARPDAVTRAALVHELREPLEGVARTLQRVSTQDLAVGADPPASRQLLRRARQLAGELRAVVDELLDGSDGAAPGGREHQETVLVGRALADVVDELGGLDLLVDCPPGLTVTTNPTQLHHLLVTALAEATRRRAGRDPVAVTARRADHEVVVTISGLRVGPGSGRGLDLIQGVAGELGGRIDVVAHSERPAALRVRIPQQRAKDASDDATGA